jgi:DHA2 family multidrug resistance protein-like MFS transporter
VEFVNMVIARQARRREWISLAVLTIPCLLYAMDLTVLNLAVPKLSQDLQPTSTELLWIVDIYGFMAAGSLVTMGTLGDRIGRRRLLLIGAAAFGATSLLAAWSTSAAMLIAARALLGVAGATVAPSTLSLIRNMFADPRQRTVAVSVWITSFSVGGAIGPLLGGILLEWFWWGSVFLLAVPVRAGWICSARPCRWRRCWRSSTGSSRSPATASGGCPWCPSWPASGPGRRSCAASAVWPTRC